jgi:hypothetical protein
MTIPGRFMPSVRDFFILTSPVFIGQSKGRRFENVKLESWAVEGTAFGIP